MRFSLAKKNVEMNPLLSQVIERHVRKLERLLLGSRSEAASLRLTLERASQKRLFESRAVLQVPGKTLTTEKSGRKLLALVEEIFDQLRREVVRYREIRRGEGAYARKRGRIGGPPEGADLGDEVKRAFLSFVDRNIGRLSRYAYREIRSQLYQGALAPGEITVAEVVDEATAEVGARSPSSYDERWILRELFRAIRRVVRREAARQHRAGFPLEKRIAPEDLDTELFEYYQPDEALRVEDLVADPHTLPPDSRVELAELEETVHRMLATLPDAWRDAFSLVAEEALSPEEAAMILRSTPQQVEANMEKARECLKRKLAELGLAGSPERR